MTDEKKSCFDSDLEILPPKPPQTGHSVLSLCTSDSDFHDYSSAVALGNRKRSNTSENTVTSQPENKRRKLDQGDGDADASQAAEDDDTPPDDNALSQENDDDDIEDGASESSLELSSLITREKCLQKAESIQIERSYGYIGDFCRCSRSNQQLYGEIEGRSTCSNYVIRIKVRSDGGLTGSCTCPSWYHWCKHLVALGLSFVQRPYSFEKVEVPDSGSNEADLSTHSDGEDDSSSSSSEDDDDEDDEVNTETEDDIPESLPFTLTERKIRRYTNGISFDRAMEYIGCFAACRKDKVSISGRLSGRSTAQEYAVTITKQANSRLDGCCSCPSYHHWCKHIAALGLTFIEHADQFTVD